MPRRQAHPSSRPTACAQQAHGSGGAGPRARARAHSQPTPQPRARAALAPADPSRAIRQTHHTRLLAGQLLQHCGAGRRGGEGVGGDGVGRRRRPRPAQPRGGRERAVRTARGKRQPVTALAGGDVQDQLLHLDAAHHILRLLLLGLRGAGRRGEGGGGSERRARHQAREKKRPRNRSTRAPRPRRLASFTQQGTRKTHRRGVGRAHLGRREGECAARVLGIAEAIFRNIFVSVFAPISFSRRAARSWCQSVCAPSLKSSQQPALPLPDIADICAAHIASCFRPPALVSFSAGFLHGTLSLGRSASGATAAGLAAAAHTARKATR